MIRRLINVLAFCVFPWLHGAADEAKVFLIGNSLTWDTVPAKLDGDVQWHVDCGKSLPFIVAHPNSPCVKSSTLWTAALKQKQFDVISIQVHYGSTLKEDVAAILRLIENQTGARVVIHTGWARSAELSAEWARSDISMSSKMLHYRAYFELLLENLRAARPEQQFCRSFAMDLLQIVVEDVELGKMQFGNVTDLYRDAIHMNVVTGRYLMHNAMRHALGQPRSDIGFEALDPQVKRYLDSVLDRGLKTKSGSSEHTKGSL